MADQLFAKGEEFERKAEKKIRGCGLFGSKHEDAADLYKKAANSFKLAKSWNKAGMVYIKLAHCNLKEIGELYEQGQNFNQAMCYFERAADLHQNEEAHSSASQCKQKVAQYSAQLRKYHRAIEIYEEIAHYSLNNNLLKYGVRGHLLNAGICQLCRGDVVAINNALEKYQDLDPTFSRTREFKFLADLAAAFDEEDTTKFTVVVKEFDSITKLDAWRTTLLLRVKESINSKELEEEDLT